MTKDADQKYEAWPLGRLPKHWQRPELNLIKELGYDWSDPRDVVGIFEQEIATLTGSKYAVSVDCCSHGLFLCMKYLNISGEITIPNRTWVSVPMQIIHAGCTPIFEDIEWSGIYQLKPYPIWDAAVRLTKDMYVPDSFMSLSFQIKKTLPIGRGGMILTDNKDAYEWLKKSRIDGRETTKRYDEDNVNMLGWHFYMTPEDAARGLMLLHELPNINKDSCCWKNYLDVSKFKVFQ